MPACREPLNYRNGFRDCTLDTRLGSLQLRIPKLRQGFILPAVPGASHLWLDATYLRQREGGRIVSVAAIIAVACDAEGRREIVGLHIGPSEAETFWAAFLKSLVRRGLWGVKLVVSDAHEGLKTAIARVLRATWQSCCVHWMGNALAHVGKAQQSMAVATLRQAFLRPDQAAARQTWRHIADHPGAEGRAAVGNARSGAALARVERPLDGFAGPVPNLGAVRHHDDLAAGPHHRGEAGQDVLGQGSARDQTFGQEPEAIPRLDRVSWFVQVVQHRLEGAIRDQAEREGGTAAQDQPAIAVVDGTR